MAKVIIIGPGHPLRGGLATFNQRLAKEYIDEGLKKNPDSGFLSAYVMKEYTENIKKD